MSYPREDDRPRQGVGDSRQGRGWVSWAAPLWLLDGDVLLGRGKRLIEQVEVGAKHLDFAMKLPADVPDHHLDEIETREGIRGIGQGIALRGAGTEDRQSLGRARDRDGELETWAERFPEVLRREEELN